MDWQNEKPAGRAAFLKRLASIRSRGYERAEGERFVGALDIGVLVGSPQSSMKAALTGARRRLFRPRIPRGGPRRRTGKARTPVELSWRGARRIVAGAQGWPLGADPAHGKLVPGRIHRYHVESATLPAGEDQVLHSSVEDAWRTMALAGACYRSNASSATPVSW